MTDYFTGEERARLVTVRVLAAERAVYEHRARHLARGNIAGLDLAEIKEYAATVAEVDAAIAILTDRIKDATKGSA